MSARGNVTLVCGAPLQGEALADVARCLDAEYGALDVLPAAPGEQAAFYTRRALRLLARAALGRRVLLHLPGASPELGAHQRRSLERVAQGLAPLVLLEDAASVPLWARAAGAPQRLPAPGRSSNRPEALAELVEKLAAGRPLNPGAGTGSWRPGGALLVGDRPNARTWRPGGAIDDAVSWPFVSQVPGGCSAWLSSQLERAWAPETALYWLNAYRASGERVAGLADVWFALRPKLTVALGKHAAQALREAGLERFTQVHHPQHWKRFHHHETYRLLKELRAFFVPPV